MTAVCRRHLYGLQLLALALVGHLPSQRLRRLLYRRVFGMKLAPGAVIYGGAHLRRPKGIEIGSGTSVGHRCELDGRAGLRIGRNVNISSEAMIWTAEHDFRDPQFTAVFEPVEIGDWVWIGPRVIVLPGVRVAEGCVVAGGAVVTRSTAPWGVYAGMPARRIAERPKQQQRYCPGKDYVPFI